MSVLPDLGFESLHGSETDFPLCSEFQSGIIVTVICACRGTPKRGDNTTKLRFSRCLPEIIKILHFLIVTSIAKALPWPSPAPT
jgi:hypothetical protein